MVTILIDSWSDEFVASLGRRPAVAYATATDEDWVMAEPEEPSFLAADAAPFWATITPSGSVTFRPTPPTVTDLQTILAGYFEPVRGTVGFVALANEDGLRLGLAANPRASGFLQHPGLVGTVALMGPADAEGEATPLPAHIRQRLVHEVIEA